MHTPHLHFIRENGYLLAFVVILIDQAGLPLPAAPVLLAAGMMVRDGVLRPEYVVALAMLASLLGHGAWYLAGRRHGVAMIRLLCRMSLEPSRCVRRTEELFKHVGPLSLLWVRFIPGLDVIAQPMVALSGMAIGPYIAITLLGAALWSSVLLAVGYAIGRVSPWGLLNLAGRPLLMTAGAALGLYWLYKLGVWLVTSGRDIPRLSPQGLQQMLASGRPLIVVDLRTRNELAISGRHIPGSVHLKRHALRTLIRQPQPQTAAVILCECPREAGSAYVAAVMRRHGWAETWALQGGFLGWRRAGMPVSAIGGPDRRLTLSPDVPIAS